MTEHEPPASLSPPSPSPPGPPTPRQDDAAQAARDLHERAALLFFELRELDPAAQESRLAAVEDPALRHEVRSLLDHDLPDPADEILVESAAWDQHPATIGPYRILGRLGRGGGGYVLLGEQQTPVMRRVAIKVVPRAMIDAGLAARFEFERRALELTDHPNIARILDAGFTPDGLPYLVMDFVDGVPLTEFCTARRVRLERRLELMLDVADAVQHIHQRGVIHRDLKPANILVSDDQGRWSPRLVDFGIAKAADGARVPELSLTSGFPLGTPAYMAPEQTGLGEVDTRADVYGLGAVLYELIAGRTPITPADDVVEFLQRIRGEVPPPPSRLRAAHPPGHDDRPPRGVLADLDRIAARALEKDPQRRYPTAAAFADDLRRVLRREPVEARPQSASYRLSRFAQRNRGLVAAVSAAALAVFVGIAGLVAGLVAARQQQREALRQSAALDEVNRFLSEDLLAAAGPERSSSDVTVVQLLDRASRRITGRLSGQPLAAAAVHHAIGAAYTQLTVFDEADRHLRTAVELRRRYAGPDHPDTLRSEIAAASLLGQRQQLDQADAELARLLPRARAVLPPDDPYLYTVLNDLGSVQDTLGRCADAIPLLEEALAGRRRTLGDQDTQVLVTMSNLAQAYGALGDSSRSITLLVEALQAAERSPEAPRMLVLGLSNNLGATYQDLGRYADAAPHLRRAADLAAQEFGAENASTLTIQANLAALEARVGDPARAVSIYEHIVHAQTSLLGPDAVDVLTARYGLYNSMLLAGRTSDALAGFSALLPDITRTLGEQHWLTAQLHIALANTLNQAGAPEDALGHAQRAVELLTRLEGVEPARLRSAQDLVRSLSQEN